MEQKQIKILNSDREDYKENIDKLKEFMDLTENSNLPLYFKTSIKNVVNSELQSLEFYYTEIENDLKNVNVDIGSLIDERLSAEQEDIMIESQLENIREERENDKN